MQTMSIVQESLSPEVDKLISKSKESLSQHIKSVAIDTAWKVLQLAVANIVKLIESSNSGLAGKDKKQIAMELLSTFYDKVFIIVTIPFVPSILQPIISRYVKTLLMLLVSASIDAMVATFKDAGIFQKTPINQ